MYALDNDTLSLFLRRQEPVTARVLAVPLEDVRLPAVVVEEQVQGRLSLLASLDTRRSIGTDKIPEAYAFLLRTLRQLENFQFLPYTEEAELLFQSWPASVKRVGTHDCRIAATAVVNGFAVVTCNTRHFGLIPGVKAEDWSR